MQSATERRLSILEYLCKHRHNTIENLSFEFGVSRSTTINAAKDKKPIYLRKQKKPCYFSIARLQNIKFLNR